ncbi:DUF2721 domain-containing protein [Sutterella megalosphaeroides]|uniref:DUF2721 domain-containing protein n=1 Tax=Sutterella megalosphaeroides TaxID=2494234 RepID=A0A2Z6I9A3_9BURK|nr:DUF2721 domain-containing protein [Sutterella megalosphaeroides]BBF22167.1 hypothetical protein SUTMEG_00580 [Sutterella megalosphaeroides]
MFEQFQNMLVNALTPITLISGVGLMMLCMTNRYNHSTDRIRQLIKKREDGGSFVEPALDKEIHLIFRRASYLRKAMLCLSLSAVCSGLLVATNVLSNFSSTNFVTISAIWLVLALGLIVVSTAFFCMEIGLSLHALGLAVEHLHEQNRDRTEAASHTEEKQS